MHSIDFANGHGGAILQPHAASSISDEVEGSTEAFVCTYQPCDALNDHTL